MGHRREEEHRESHEDDSEHQEPDRGNQRGAARVWRIGRVGVIQPIGDPSTTVKARRRPKSATTKASAWTSLERVDRCCTPSPLKRPVAPVVKA
jgi:hypothetical protein